MSKQISAVEWLADEIIMLEEKLRIEEININDFIEEKDLLVEQAKAMEKEQIIRTHLMARCYDNQNSFTEAEQYYKETFKSE